MKVKMTKYDTSYSSLKADIIIIKGYIEDVFQSFYTTIISNI